MQKATTSPRIQHKKARHSPKLPVRISTEKPEPDLHTGPRKHKADGGDPTHRCRPTSTRWFKLSHRPYIGSDDRRRIRNAIQNGRLAGLPSIAPITYAELPCTYHVDFSEEEIEYVWKEARALRPSTKVLTDPIKGIARILRKNPQIATLLPEKIQGQGPVSKRDNVDIYWFISDVNNGTVSRVCKLYTLRGPVPPHDARKDARAQRLSAFRLRREIEGQSLSGRTKVFGGLKNEIRRTREDGLDLRAVWTGCAGDIATIAWVSETAFVCGTTEHSDAHNQQYNRPGNLLLGSTSAGTLRAFPDHRIVRPVVAKGENASEAMRQSQDPWLYSSVVSSAYDPTLDIAYTSSFDKTVKAWKVDENGKTMQLAGSWEHRGNVNFVVTSHHDNLVATASDVAVGAIRIYKVKPGNISSSPYFEFGGKLAGTAGPTVEADIWAYYPATIQWGIAPICSHHLLVGYSPRSFSGDDTDIPETKRNSGELRMFNAITGGEISMGIPMCQNVFEVVWHPTRPVFIVGMTVGASKAEAEVRTQVRVFAYSTKSGNVTSTAFRPESRAFATDMGMLEDFYGFTMVLDCFSSDINELTIKPNSPEYFYATAACTDGKVYVWDTSQGHRPIHILSHGEPVEPYSGEREREDTGSKFTAWGSTPDRFYTGGSDGVVKAWNIRHPHPFIRDVLEVSGPVSAGAFCPDKSKLAIGDASGRVYLLSVDEEDNVADDTVKLPLGGGLYNTTARTRSVHRPKPYIPHPEPLPPPGHLPNEEADSSSGILRARSYLQRGQLLQHKNPVLGVFQGPNYAQLNLYRREAHFDEDPSNPLLADAERNQQVNKLSSQSVRGGIGSRISFGRGRRVVLNEDDEKEALRELHQRNLEKDLDWEGLNESVRAELLQSGADPRVEEDYGFEFEDEESDDGDDDGSDAVSWDSLSPY